MIKKAAILFIGLILCVIPQVAEAGLESGVSAFEQGDYRSAYRELRPLAEKGDPKAQYYLGYMYGRGIGVARDAMEALKWIKPAAEKGIPEAQYLMAYGFAGVPGNPYSPTEAIRWLTLAANQGHVGAQEHLANRYTQGRDVSRDLVQASMWCEIAELNGAKDCLYSVPTYQMTADQRADGKRLAQEWVTKHAAANIVKRRKGAKELISQLDQADYKRKNEIVNELVLLGDESIRVILEAFRSEDFKHAEHLLKILCTRGSEASSAIPELISLFQSPTMSDTNKGYVLSALSCVGSTSTDVQSLMISLLKGNNDAMRIWAVMSLDRFDSKEAVLALADVLSDTKPSLRETVAGVLLRKGPKAAPAIPALGKALDQKGNYIAEVAANALKAIGTPEAMAELKKHGIE